MLICVPRSICSWNFLVHDDAGGTAALDFAFFTEQGAIDYEGTAYTVTKHGYMSGRWSLLHDSQPVATAHKPSALFRHFVVSVGETLLVLEAHSVFSRGYDILSGPKPVGSIRPVHPFTRRAFVECLPSVPVLAQLFCFWLAVLTWRRAAHSSNAAAPAGH